ncbi:MAG: 23S rRNA (cytidine(2498)-2'-O)-methyltransferase RlmM [Dokdonella sp.]|uniref:23S rRNA (cytidine(2498)-2'-O)-methyltransferase RlmM n=1 Tax=Dokdonella sp. TaxID=2291710 RepID=UPI0025BEBDEE|nr:23S rRNA (cytidine(2498)-2'-O)-methyltransferase RlmM [Dokdonella sp.]MBX3699471.1 23S rRNA (cytidine(2498)-2'-O)-methyltransferase RlmM [Dokdonella sp.]MCW5577819.1 23S rRNA (cytidine(2498)-2'-O)-methyltransferase RlmM [Dokdonella sp.]
MSTPAPTALLAYCRPGFEAELAQELAAHDLGHGGGGYARSERGSGFVEFVSAHAATLAADWHRFVFARQALVVLGRARDMPAQDRISALLPLLEADPRRWCDVVVEAPDNDAARELAALCRGLNAALLGTLRQRHLLERDSRWRLHVCLESGRDAFVCAADVARSSPWPGGIPRLKFPPGAPSRSTLKLEEALLVLLDADERARWLREGMRAVDLGAAPGGWTWQLVRRRLHVTAVDNGPMDAGLMASGLVEHLRADGFAWQPRKSVDWLVCDMVEQPRRVAARIAHWLAQGWCRYTIFNLKLPMKKRYAEVELCLDLLRNEVAAPLDLRARQLYHDREEITVFARPT